MPRPLIDLLWRDHPDAPPVRSRGPRATHAVADVVDAAVALADRSGLTAVTIRSLAADLAISTMSVYTHVDGRDDLLVLMVDAVHGDMRRPGFGRAGWRTRVRRTAEANLALHAAHPWLRDVGDPRVAWGPGTIAKYDHELRAFDSTRLGDVERDAALTFLLDFVAAGAAARAEPPYDMMRGWAQVADRLGRYVGEDHPLARRVGRAAGESMGAPYDAERAWRFGLDRVMAGLADLIEGDGEVAGPR